MMEPNNVSYYPNDDPGANQLGQYAQEHQGQKVIFFHNHRYYRYHYY